MTPNPFKHIRFIKTTLHLIAFGTACSTIILLKLLSKEQLQWTLKSTGVLALSVLGFVALLMVKSLSSKDRPKTLLLIILFLGSWITIIVLSVQEFLRYSRAESTASISANDHHQQSNKIDIYLSQPSQGDNIQQSSMTNVATTGNDTPPSQIGNGKTESLNVAMSKDSQESRIWIIPRYSFQVQSKSFSYQHQDGPPPLEQSSDEKWEISGCKIPNSSDEREWYIGGPWTLSGGQGAYLTNFLSVVPKGHVIISGTVYSTKRSRTYTMRLLRPQVSGSTIITTDPPSPQPTTEVKKSESIDTSHENSVLEFLRIYARFY